MRQPLAVAHGAAVAWLAIGLVMVQPGSSQRNQTISDTGPSLPHVGHDAGWGLVWSA